jgi:NAD(P)-dependent dehydrogenase (short-subunit alcohol dehydrogenase family)
MTKTALITGGSRGIGLGIARELAKAHFNLVINGMRDADAVAPVIRELTAGGCQVTYVQGDISLETDRKKIIRLALEKFSKLNVLVNNAGIAPRERKDILEATEKSFDQVISTNLKGPYFLTQLVANQMIRQIKENLKEFCCIIIVSSVSASMASTNRGEYCISKAGIAMATRLWASRLGEFGIPVYEIRPGVITTDMTTGVKEKYDKLFNQGLAIQSRWGNAGRCG